MLFKEKNGEEMGNFHLNFDFSADPSVHSKEENNLKRGNRWIECSLNVGTVKERKISLRQRQTYCQQTYLPWKFYVYSCELKCRDHSEINFQN